jgi:hypothetical protein
MRLVRKHSNWKAIGAIAAAMLDALKGNPDADGVGVLEGERELRTYESATGREPT